jgi:hypothetical protein
MRGGAIPLLVWGTILLVLYIGNWIWDGTRINPAVTGFALLVIYLAGLLFWLMSRQAIRKGPPEADLRPRALPRISAGAAGVGISVGVILYGVVFGKFLVFIGGALLVLSLGRVGRELLWQERSLHAVRRRLRRQ